jgi:NAD+ diphosphatase
VSGGVGLLVRESNGQTALPEEAIARSGEGPPLYLGTLNGADCWATIWGEGRPAPEGFAFRSLRSLYGALPDEVFVISGRALQLVEWEQTHRFCGRCARRTEGVENERARRCLPCDRTYYPRISPAVIVLVHKGNEVLLAHNARAPEGMFSTLAGFVESGESLEETVAREILEEVGVQVKSLRYFGSQPWPFPHSLMIGFHAEYAGGEIHSDGAEIVEANWYRPDPSKLPKLPPKLSIARRLIDDWLSSQGVPID